MLVLNKIVSRKLDYSLLLLVIFWSIRFCVINFDWQMRLICDADFDWLMRLCDSIYNILFFCNNHYNIKHMTAILKMGESVTSKYSSQALNSRRGK